MKKFMDKNFILETKTARSLFAACQNEPLWDYHCHLSPKEIAENKQFKNLTEIWLGGDHYKWRQMRTYGIEEKYITGDASDYEKFLKWAETIEHLIGNPLYHWTHLELQRYFGIYEPLSVKSAPVIWEKANSMLKSPELSVKGIFKKFNVYGVGTTDDPVDSLEYHKAIREGTAPIGKIDTLVCPSFRPDKALYIHKPDFKDYIEKLSQAAGMQINNSDDVIKALENRLDYFVQNGCLVADHGLSYPPYTQAQDEKARDKAADELFKAAMEGKQISEEEGEAYITKVLSSLAVAYKKRGIVMQLHMNVIRNINQKAFETIGPDTGFDAVHDNSMAEKLSAFLNLCELKGGLPKTILYSLNPKDYYAVATIMGSFQGDGIKGKIQLGSGWWFCDHKDGMEQQLKVLGNLGMLPTFVGMLTDSRSFLSYTRHEYFRRILCNLIGNWVENGEFPDDRSLLEDIVKDISFRNAKNYFALNAASFIWDLN